MGEFERDTAAIVVDGEEDGNQVTVNAEDDDKLTAPAWAKTLQTPHPLLGGKHYITSILSFVSNTAQFIRLHTGLRSFPPTTTRTEENSLPDYLKRRPFTSSAKKQAYDASCHHC